MSTQEILIQCGVGIGIAAHTLESTADAQAPYRYCNFDVQT